MSRLDITPAWHAAYCRWFDRRDTGHEFRAAAWGAAADALVRFGDRFRLWGSR